MLGSIDGRRDLSGGRRSTDEFTAQHNMQGKYFKSVCYSADGEFLIAAGQSKYVCIYSLRSKCLVRKYPLTQNLSLEGNAEFSIPSTLSHSLVRCLRVSESISYVVMSDGEATLTYLVNDTQ